MIENIKIIEDNTILGEKVQMNWTDYIALEKLEAKVI